VKTSTVCLLLLKYRFWPIWIVGLILSNRHNPDVSAEVARMFCWIWSTFDRVIVTNSRVGGIAWLFSSDLADNFLGFAYSWALALSVALCIYLHTVWILPLPLIPFLMLVTWIKSSP